VIDGKTGLPVGAIREFSFLQFRMVSELVGIGCLIAHGDITAFTKDLRETWEPGKIFAALVEFSPDFYPKAMKQVPDQNANHVEELASGFLTRKELVSLHGRSGDVLHRGGLSRFTSSDYQSPYDGAEIIESYNKLLALLSIHVIKLPDNQIYLCALQTQGGDVLVVHSPDAKIEAIGASAIEPSNKI
jgi:hypothetical protein